MTCSGDMNKLIIIQTQTTTQDSYGQPQDTWADTYTVYANIKPLVGKEYFQAQQIQSDLTHDVTTRYRTGIKPKMRIKYGSRYFEIHAVIDPEEAHQWMYLKCREVVI